MLQLVLEELAKSGPDLSFVPKGIEFFNRWSAAPEPACELPKSDPKP
jgi:hypothetical protein